jgi:hypothetical protein
MAQASTQVISLAWMPALVAAPLSIPLDALVSAGRWMELRVERIA